MPSYDNFDGTKWVRVASADGVTDGSEASSGERGEWLYQAQADSNAMSLANGQPTDVLAYAVPPGDWDLFGAVRTLGTSTNIVDMQAWISDTPGTSPPSDTFAFVRFNLGAQGQSGADTTLQLITGPARINTSVPAVVYLGCRVSWTSGTVLAAGSLRGRRMR